jgi:hypothetical protein
MDSLIDPIWKEVNRILTNLSDSYSISSKVIDN